MDWPTELLRSEILIQRIDLQTVCLIHELTTNFKKSELVEFSWLYDLVNDRSYGKQNEQLACLLNSRWLLLSLNDLPLCWLKEINLERRLNYTMVDWLPFNWQKDFRVMTDWFNGELHSFS